MSTRHLLMQGDHWRVSPVDLANLFRAIHVLAPSVAFVALADGARSSSSVRERIGRISTNPGEEVRDLVSREFRHAEYVPVTDANMATLATLAEGHAEPEIATHVAALTPVGLLLEWFDLPGDPISISPVVTAAAVASFARECDTTTEWMAGGV